MKNYDNFRHASVQFMAAFFVLVVACSPSMAETVEKTDRPAYHELKGSWPDGEADVVEFFSYNCTYCQLAEKSVEEFLHRKPGNVHFQRYAVSAAQPGWSLSAEAFRAAHLAGVEQRMSPKLFARMKNEQGVFADQASVRAFFDQEGVGELANKYLDSPESLALRKHIFKLAQGIQLGKTPTFVVGGRYIVYWGTDHTPESFADLVMAVYRRATTEAQASCSVKALDDDVKISDAKAVAPCE